MQTIKRNNFLEHLINFWAMLTDLPWFKSKRKYAEQMLISNNTSKRHIHTSQYTYVYCLLFVFTQSWKNADGIFSLSCSHCTTVRSQ